LDINNKEIKNCNATREMKDNDINYCLIDERCCCVFYYLLHIIFIMIISWLDGCVLCCTPESYVFEFIRAEEKMHSLVLRVLRTSSREFLTSRFSCSVSYVPCHHRTKPNHWEPTGLLQEALLLLRYISPFLT